MKPVDKLCETCKARTPHMPGGDDEGNLKMFCCNYKNDMKDNNEVKPDYSKGCARFNEITCDCDTHIGQCKSRDYDESKLSKWTLELQSQLQQTQE